MGRGRVRIVPGGGGGGRVTGLRKPAPSRDRRRAQIAKEALANRQTRLKVAKVCAITSFSSSSPASFEDASQCVLVSKMFSETR